MAYGAMRVTGSVWRQRTIGGFTMVELLVVAVVVGVITSAGAMGLSSHVPGLKLRSQTLLFQRVLLSARERAMSEGVTQKVRIYQTRRVNSIRELFRRDGETFAPGQSTYGTHQMLYAAPVVAWHSEDFDFFLPSTVMPAALKTADEYDEAAPAFLPYYPIISAPVLDPTLSNTVRDPTSGQLVCFPISLANMNLSGVVELDTNIRIVQINGLTTWRDVAPFYGDAPYTNPIPRNPNTSAVSGAPPRPTGNPYSFDDRILDATYSPDGVFKFTPAHTSPTADYSITLATSGGAVNLSAGLDRQDQANSEVTTIVIDRSTGVPRI